MGQETREKPPAFLARLARVWVLRREEQREKGSEGRSVWNWVLGPGWDLKENEPETTPTPSPPPPKRVLSGSTPGVFPELASGVEEGPWKPVAGIPSKPSSVLHSWATLSLAQCPLSRPQLGRRRRPRTQGVPADRRVAGIPPTAREPTLLP